MFLVSSTRYAMGRSSYIVGSTADAVRKYWDYLRPEMHAVLLRDVSEELDRAERMGGTLGMDMDHRTWKGLLAWMKERT